MNITIEEMIKNMDYYPLKYDKNYIVRIELHINSAVDRITINSADDIYKEIRTELQNPNNTLVTRLNNIFTKKIVNQKYGLFDLPDAEYFLNTNLSFENVVDGVHKFCDNILKPHFKPEIDLNQYYSVMVNQIINGYYSHYQKNENGNDYFDQFQFVTY